MTVTGAESLAWDQTAADATQLVQYSFAVYVDGDRRPLPDAACSAGSSAASFGCFARLPAMAPGAHRLELATVLQLAGTSAESVRSAPLDIVVVPASATRASTEARASARGVTADGINFVVETLATGFDAPSGLAVTPEGRVFVAERSGTVSVWANGGLSATPAWRAPDAADRGDAGLVGIAVDPEFTTNQRVYLAYTANAGNGSYINRVERFREVGNLFGERVTLLEDPAPTLPRRAPRIRVGADTKLYVVFASDRGAVREPASYPGKLLRLNEDGTTPRDNARYSPVVSDVAIVPLAFAWQPATGHLWQVARDLREREIVIRGHPRDRTELPAAVIEPGIDASGVEFYAGSAIPGFKDDMFVSAWSGQLIERVRFDPSNPARIVGMEGLLERRFGRIADVVQGPDGALYFCTSNRGVSAQPMLEDRLARIAPAAGAAMGK